MSSRRSHLAYALIGTLWAAGVAFGVCRLWSFQSAAGETARPPLTWPHDTGISRASGMPTLVLFVHPRCPCSRATLDELAKVMTDCKGRLVTTVLFLRPKEMPDGWERTSLWDKATAIPGVSVRVDPEGAEASRFGAATSGQAILYSPDGRLIFAGGMTASRGHDGDNDGCNEIVSLVAGNNAPAPRGTVPVYGCPLFSSSCPSHQEGTPACHRK